MALLTYSHKFLFVAVGGGVITGTDCISDCVVVVDCYLVGYAVVCYVFNYVIWGIGYY